MSTSKKHQDAHSVYEIEFPDGKIYVGCTCDFPQRIRSHHSSPSKMILRHMKKTGYKLFECDIRCIEVLPNKREGLNFEKQRISELHEQGVCLNYYKGKQTRAINVITTHDGVELILYSNGKTEPINKLNKAEYMKQFEENK